jgi:hypothetical protein
MRLFYHGTSSIAVEGILSEGLIPKKGKGCDAWAAKVKWRRFGSLPLVFLVEQAEKAIPYAQIATSVAGGRPILIEVRIPNADSSRLRFDGLSAWMFEGTIPTEWVAVSPIQVAPRDFSNWPRFPAWHGEK